MTDTFAKDTEQDVRERASRIGAVLELAGIEHDPDSAAALCVLACVCARRSQATEADWLKLARASWNETNSGKWSLEP